MQSNISCFALETQKGQDVEDEKAKGFTWNMGIKQEMSNGNPNSTTSVFSAFNKPLSENDNNSWFVNNNNDDPNLLHPNFQNQSSQNNHDLIPQPQNSTHTLRETSMLHPMESSSAPYGVNATDSADSFLPHKPYLSSLLSAVCNYPFDTSLDLICDSGFFEPLHESQGPGFGLSSPVLMGFNNVASDLTLISQNSGSNLLPLGDDFGGATIGGAGGLSTLGLDYYGNANPSFVDTAKRMRPLDSIDSEIPLFQKRMAVPQNSEESLEELGVMDKENARISIGLNLDKGKGLVEERQMHEDKREELNGSSFNSDSEEPAERLMSNASSYGVEISNGDSSVIDVDGKGKKERLPAKNLMAERRRRKKLNDRLYMLRSVVPKISKMDRASILADAIDYLKELLQRVKELNNELQSLASISSLPPDTGLVQPTSSGSALPFHVKEEMGRMSLPIPPDQQPTVHVEAREENAFNIHMFCSRRPGLLLSTIRALENLGLDVQQAVISCFNGFALDVFRAEQCNEALAVHGDQIKTALLETAAFHGLM